MNQASTGLVRLFKALANHYDLISEAYFKGVVYRNKQNERALSQLRQLKILVKHSEEGYRISGGLSHFIDNALSSDRVRRLDTDLASWIETLEQQIGLYQDAWSENRQEDSDHYYAEIERLVFDLSDALEENTRYLLMLVNSRFANVRTLSEKQKQNSFYISRVEKLVNAVSSLQPEFLLEMVEEQPILFALLEQQLIRLLPVYQQRLQDILDKLKVFLFEFRQIEVQAQRVQGFAFFLRQNPAYQPQEWSETDHIPDIWNQISPLKIHAFADPMDHSIEESLIDIVKKIKIETDALLAKQKKRSLNSVALNPKIKQKMDIPLYRKQLKAYVVFVRKTPGKQISALAYRQVFVEEILPEIWLACVLNACLSQKNKALKMDLLKIEHESAFSGNQKLTDILLTYQG